MRGFHRFLAIIFLFLGYAALFAQSNGFQIIYMADTKYAKDSLWVRNIKTDWHATGINLRIRWADVVNGSFNRNWADVDAALQQLDRDTLDIYIRVSFIFTRPGWFSPICPNGFS